MRGFTVLLLIAALAAAIFGLSFLRMYSVLTYERPIAAFSVEKLGAKRYLADVRFENGHRESFLIAGDQIEFAADHVLLRNWAKAFRSDAADGALYRLAGLRGVYRKRSGNFPECPKDREAFVAHREPCETNYALDGPAYSENAASNPSWMEKIGKMVVTSALAKRQDGSPAYAIDLKRGDYEVCITDKSVLVADECNNTLVESVLN